MIIKLLFLTLAFFSFLPAFSASVPSIVLKNQYGEVANDYIIGGSSQISAKFIVDPANANGLGQRSLSVTGASGTGIANVYMNTTATPASGNPNPSPGFIVVKFATGYSGHLVDAHSVGAPGNGVNVNVSSGLLQGKAYVLSVVGTTTATQWRSVGLPSNLTPTVSQSFIATTGTPTSGTGQAQLISPSLIETIEVIGDPALNVNTSDNTGGQVLLQALGSTSASVTSLIPKAPQANSMIELQFVLTPDAGSPL